MYWFSAWLDLGANVSQETVENLWKESNLLHLNQVPNSTFTKLYSEAEISAAISFYIDKSKRIAGKCTDLRIPVCHDDNVQAGSRNQACVDMNPEYSSFEMLGKREVERLRKSVHLLRLSLIFFAIHWKIAWKVLTNII